MPDLSQAEIDALFGRYESGADLISEEEPEEEIVPQPVMRQSARHGRMSYVPRRPVAVPKKNYKLYDFKDPKFFSKDQLRHINVVYDNYAKHMSQFMSGTLRAECVITLESVEEQKYKEYNNALPDSIMMGIFSMEPVIEGDFFYNISKPTCYAIIDRLLGGTGDDIVVQDDFSEIEMTLLGNFFKSTLRYIKESWSNVIDVEPRFKRIETNARLSQLMPFEDTVLIVMLKVKIKEQEGNISICIPCLNLEAILSNASTYAHSSRRKSDANKGSNRENLLDHVKNSKLDIAGILGTTTLKLRDLLYLQAGDYIVLDKHVESPITVRIGNHELYTAEIGMKKNKIAMKIKDVL